jgi:HEPN domain-containing protein
MADEDYIAARMAYRAGLSYVSLWASQQAIEKYLKCILLLNRIPAPRVFHHLDVALKKIEDSGKVSLNLKQVSLDFIKYIDEIGAFRYFEVSRVVSSRDFVKLDRVVWELRRFCSLDSQLQSLELQMGVVAPRYALAGGLLEKVTDTKTNPARQALLWNNGFIGKRKRRMVKFPSWMKMRNAPLYMHPEILDELLKYVHLPTPLISSWKQHKSPGYEAVEE